MLLSLLHNALCIRLTLNIEDIPLCIDLNDIYRLLYPICSIGYRLEPNINLLCCAN